MNTLPPGSQPVKQFARYLFQKGAITDGLVASLPLEVEEVLVKVSAVLGAGTTTLTPSYDSAKLSPVSCKTVRAAGTYSQVLQAQHTLSLSVAGSSGASDLAIAIVTQRVFT